MVHKRCGQHRQALVNLGGLHSEQCLCDYRCIGRTRLRLQEGAAATTQAL